MEKGLDSSLRKLRAQQVARLESWAFISPAKGINFMTFIKKLVSMLPTKFKYKNVPCQKLQRRKTESSGYSPHQ